MLARLATACALALSLAACAAAPAPTAVPAAAPFPSATPGRQLAGWLPTLEAAAGSGAPLNPATAVALARRPTVTPDYDACPPLANPPLGPPPASARQAADSIAAFLSAGGAPQTLPALLQSAWGLSPESFTVRADADLTGAGVPAVLAAVPTPEGGTLLLALACANGRYIVLHEAVSSDPVQIIHAGDINLDARPDLLYTAQQCEADGESCVYRTQLLSWDANTGSLISLLASPITSPTSPTLVDVDGDGILEIALRLTDTGTADTGPLRTGVTLYDWDGAGYALSITQLDPPRFRIQIIHEADRSLLRQELSQAAAQYALALSDSSLRNWYNDDDAVLKSYALFRLLTAYAYTEDARLLSVYQELGRLFPDPAAAPIYALLADAFWRAFQVSNNLNSACAAVQDIITARPEALSLINRYGSRSPTYTASDLCPF